MGWSWEPYSLRSARRACSASAGKRPIVMLRLVEVQRLVLARMQRRQTIEIVGQLRRQVVRIGRLASPGKRVDRGGVGAESVVTGEYVLGAAHEVGTQAH